VHLDEEVELYALGDLDEGERRRVEQHAAACPACARRLAESCETVFELAGLLPDAGEIRVPARRVRGIWSGLAVVATAAAIALAAVTALLLARLDTQRAELAMLQAPVAAMARGHFAHVPLQPSDGATPRGKVIYAIDRSWSYVLVDARGPYALWVRRNGAWRSAGELQGAPAAAMVHGPVDAVAVGMRGTPEAAAILRADLPRVAPTGS